MSLNYWISIVIFSLLSCTQNGSEQTKKNEGQEAEVNLETEPADMEESRDRTVWQKPYDVIHMIGPLAGKTIADIGAGSGYFSFRFVHEAEKVIAIDIDQELIGLMNQEKMFYRQEIQNRIEARLAEPDDPNLKDREVDVVFLSNTYPYIKNRIQYLKNLIPKFKPGGKIMIVDFKKKLTPFGPSQKNRMAQSEVEQEIISAGYQLLLSDDLKLEYQYIIIAQPAN